MPGLLAGVCSKSQEKQRKGKSMPCDPMMILLDPMMILLHPTVLGDCSDSLLRQYAR